MQGTHTPARGSSARPFAIKDAMSELFQTRATLNLVARALFDQEELESIDPKIYGDFALVVEACSRMVLNTITALDELDSTQDVQRGRKS